MDDFAAGDPASALAIWSPAIRWYSVGNNPLAGRRVGHDETVAYLAEMARLTRGTFRSEILEVRPLFGHTYVARFRNRAQVNEHVLDVESSLIIDGEGDRVSSVVEVHHDEAAWDAFWTAAGAAAGGVTTPAATEPTASRGQS
jgi:ketosteroid isomerase-like protein